jgi:hypothetical protein
MTCTSLLHAREWVGGRSPCYLTSVVASPMMRRTSPWAFRMSMGKMLVNYKLQTRDLKLSLQVEDAEVDVTRKHCVAPRSWLEALRSPSKTLPTGYYTEKPVYVAPPKHKGGELSNPEAAAKKAPNAVRAGPLLMYIEGQPSPAAVYVDFVDEEEWGMDPVGELDLRVGMEAVEQCTLVTELRPGGLLSSEPLSVLKDRGLMQVGLAESPFARRPWTRMKTYFIDELQRGPRQMEFVGYNPRQGRQWRFSQHCKHFRIGIWREMTRTGDLHEGLQAHSSYQRSPQQAVPEVRNMAPSP